MQNPPNRIPAEQQPPQTRVWVQNPSRAGLFGWLFRYVLFAILILGVGGAYGGLQLYRYNFETIELLRESALSWEVEARSRGFDLHTRVAEVAFENLADEKERRFFNEVKTSFNLDDETVDRLIEVGGRLLRESPDFQAFLSHVK